MPYNSNSRNHRDNAERGSLRDQQQQRDANITKSYSNYAVETYNQKENHNLRSGGINYNK